MLLNARTFVSHNAFLIAGQRSVTGPHGLPLLPFALVAAIPAAVMNLGRAGIPCTPLILAAGLLALIVAAKPVSEASAETRASAPI